VGIPVALPTSSAYRINNTNPQTGCAAPPRDRIARRDAARARFEQKREAGRDDRMERAAAIREKDKATMDMFMQMAKQKYG